MAKPEKALFVVFGLTRSGRARGACFSSEQNELALEAATTPEMTAFEAVSPEMKRLALKLPSGRGHSKKRPSLPPITMELYRKLYIASGGLVRDRDD